jgi:osmotically-inducible protein OsmY
MMMRNVLIVAMVAVDGLTAGCAGMRAGGTAAAAPAVDDATLTANITKALAGDPELAPIKVTVDSEKGVVRLRGEVKTFALRQKIEAKAKAVSGVKSIDNQLIITG